MTSHPRPPVKVRNVQIGVAEFLDGAGFDAAAVEGLLSYDLAMFRWRRMTERGLFLNRVLRDFDGEIEPSILHGLLTIAQFFSDLDGSTGQPPTVGQVAEKMRVDPSRASRIVSELVTRGYVERRAAQDDARKTVLVLAPQAGAFLKRFTAAKWQLLAQVFEGWSSEEISGFSRLFSRYLDSLAELVDSPDDPGCR